MIQKTDTFWHHLSTINKRKNRKKIKSGKNDELNCFALLETTDEDDKVLYKTLGLYFTLDALLRAFAAFSAVFLILFLENICCRILID
jgi:hypothetical protein